MADVHEIFQKMVAELGPENHLLQAFEQSRIVAPEALNEFECQGCGLYCCLDKTIILRPSEYYRISWFLQRHAIPLRTGQWAAIGIGGMSGTPVARIAFEPTETGGPLICPFVQPVFDQDGRLRYPQARCAIYEQRPGPCRIYPYGRGEVRDPDTDEFHQILSIVERCEGFDAPLQAPQTVAEFVQASRPPDFAAEIDTCNRLLYRFAQSGLHEPTPDNPSSILPAGLAFGLLAPLLYTAPSCPQDPAEDHTVIVAHLETIEGKRAQLVALFGRMAEKTLSPDQGIAQVMALVA